MATFNHYALLNNEKEKRYTHHPSKASWAGARIIQEQWPPHAHSLFDLLVLKFGDKGKVVDLQRMRTASGVNDEEWRDVLAKLMYTVHTLNSLVNYKSFGFTKIVPHISASSFAAAVKNSNNSHKAVPGAVQGPHLFSAAGIVTDSREALRSTHLHGRGYQLRGC